MSYLRRAFLVAAIAAIAVVPLRAFGVVGAEAPSGLSVSASLGGCGVGGEGIVCTIDVGFSGVEGADYYTGTLTRADGSVQDLGAIGSGEGGGGASVSVPYVGAGNYSVTVSAWGTPDDGEEGEKPELLDRERAKAGDEDSGEVSSEPAPDEPAAETESDPASEPSEPAPAETTPAPADPAPQTLPQCPAEPPAPEPAADSDTDEADAAPPAPPPPAPIVECTTPSSDASGPCCPPGA